VIVRLGLYDEKKDNIGQIVRTLKPIVLQKNKILKSSALRKQRVIALQLIADFLSGKRQANEVFDAVKLGQYLATIDLWGAWHALTWNNLRWYYNPHTALLEPIQSDVAISPAVHHWLIQPPSQSMFLGRKMLVDPIIKRQYQFAIRQLKLLIDSKELLIALTDHQKKILKKLYASAPLTPEFELSHLKKQIHCITNGYNDKPCNSIDKMDPKLHHHMHDVNVVSNWDLVSSYSSQDNHLTIHNNNNKALNLKGIIGTSRFDDIDLLEEANTNLPQIISPNTYLRIPIAKDIKSVIVRAAFNGDKMASYEFNKNINATSFIARPADIKKNFFIPF
jgi:hypothetical protein